MASLAILGGLAGCGDDPIDPPVPTEQLLEEPISAEDTLELSDVDDYWSTTYGAYLSPEELELYLDSPAGGRFAEWGYALLSARLSEEALARARGELNEQQLEEFRSLPTWSARDDYLATLIAPVDTQTEPADRPADAGERSPDSANPEPE